MSQAQAEMQALDPLAGSPAPRLRQIINAAGHAEFDLRVQHVDAATGVLEKEAHYIRRVSAEKGVSYEAPPKSGFIYNEKGELVADQNKEKREKAEAEKAAAELAAVAATEAAEKARVDALAAERQGIIDAANREAEAIKATAREAANNFKRGGMKDS